MKKIMSKLVALVMVVGVVLSGVSSVYASEYSKTLSMSSYKMSSTPVKFPTSFNVKKSSDGEYVYCLTYSRKVPKSSIKYTVSDTIDRAGTNYILQEAYNNAKNDKDYFVYQTALWVYLLDKGYMKDSATVSSFKKTLSSSSNSYAKKIKSLVSTAKSKSSNSYRSEAKISLSGSNVKFTLKDGYYVSSTITLNNSEKDYKIDIDSDISGVKYESKLASGSDSSDGTYKYNIVISVPEDNVTKSDTITVKVSTSKTIYTAYRYKASDSSYQEMAKLYKSTSTASDTLKLNIAPTTGNVVISKQDATTGKELAGAHLVVKDANGNTVDEWDSTDEVHTINNLTPGDYTLTETIAPDGYDLSTESVKFTVKSDGSTTQVVMKNAPSKKVNSVQISKQDATTSEELEGAHLVVKDANGNIIDEWDSETTPHVITDIAAGDYTLTETIAPDGYVLSSETVKFTVKDDGSTTKVVMKNTKEETPKEETPKEDVVVPSTGTHKSVVTPVVGSAVLIVGSVLITKNLKKKNEK